MQLRAEPEVLDLQVEALGEAPLRALLVRLLVDLAYT